MAYESRKKKISTFAVDDALTDSSTLDFIKDGINKKTSWANIRNKLSEVFGLGARLFATEAELIASDIAIGEYAIVEENNTALYKITSLAANSYDVTLTSGFTASLDGPLLLEPVADYTALRAINTKGIKTGQTLSVTNSGIGGPGVLRNVVAHGLTDNGGTIIVISADWYWERPIQNMVNVMWFEVDNTGATDDTLKLQAAVNLGKTAYFPAGTYMGSISLLRAQIICGEGSRTAGSKSASRLIPPPGASYTVVVDGDAATKQHCKIRDLSIENPNGVANCDGLYFKSASITAINDSHRIEDVFIDGFRYGIRVGARLIISLFENVEVQNCTKGMYVTADAANYAYNLNTFIQCRFVDCTEEGYRQTGFNIANKFISCDIEGCNSDDTLGTAGMYVENAEGLYLDNCYFELNGGGAAVDAVDRLNNSIGLLLGGARCFNLKIDNGWYVQSGTMVAFEDTTSIIGGYIGGARWSANTNGIDIYCKGTIGAINVQPLIIDSNNYFSRGVEIPAIGTGLHTGSIRQSRNTVYMVSATNNPNLLTADTLNINSASGFTFTDIDNRLPGLRLTINNLGTGSIVIPSAITAAAINITIFPGEIREFFVSGFPAAGKIREIGRSSRYSQMAPTTVAGLTTPSASATGAGARAFVTDATATTFASIVAGGGANGVPVYSDGTNWRIG